MTPNYDAGLLATDKLFLSVTRCPGCGSARIFWRGKALRTINLASAVRAPALVLVGAFAAPQVLSPGEKSLEDHVG